MPELLTSEFSICFSPDDQTSQDLLAVRDNLPPSPYRDDQPHLTFMRGITAAAELSDEDLLSDISPLLDTSPLPFAGKVYGVGNGSNERYTLASGLLLQLPPGVLDYRTTLAQRLETGGYQIEPNEVTKYIPHMTVRLGVPLLGDTFKATHETFIDRQVTFSRWFLYRLILRDGQRFGRQVSP